MQRQPHLFESQRLTLHKAIQMTVASVRAYAPLHDRWAISWSGGKDSTATLTVLMHLMNAGEIPRPRSLSVLYADTRQELPPLYASALGVMERLREMDIDVRVCRAPLDKRFLVYMLGRGVPPPNNNTLRWCTRQIKLHPMAATLAKIIGSSNDTVLSITGVRQGESSVRDHRIAMSCSRDGAECGQGWYQNVLPEAPGVRGRIATLAPLIHWRVCHVWEWLKFYAPHRDFGAWPVRAIADAYGGDEAEEINARTGCIGCPLASRDAALEAITEQPDWAYLMPLHEMRPLYRELRQPRHRLRKEGYELRRDGTAAANPQRMGPLTLNARRMALHRILLIQERCNLAARHRGRPHVNILNDAEVQRIKALIDAETWPMGWDGTEPVATESMDVVFQDGTVQPLML